ASVLTLTNTASSTIALHDALPILLGEYHLGLLSKEFTAAVSNHLSMCELCAAEVATLTEFLANDQMLARPAVARDMSVQTSSPRSEEHTSELQSRVDLVCRLLLAK